MSPFLLAFFKLFQWRLREGNDLVDISVDFRTTERASITQEGNLIHDRLFMKISVDDRSRMDESL